MIASVLAESGGSPKHNRETNKRNRDKPRNHTFSWRLMPHRGHKHPPQVAIGINPSTKALARPCNPHLQSNRACISDSLHLAKPRLSFYAGQPVAGHIPITRDPPQTPEKSVYYTCSRNYQSHSRIPPRNVTLWVPQGSRLVTHPRRTLPAVARTLTLGLVPGRRILTLHSSMQGVYRPVRRPSLHLHSSSKTSLFSS